MSSPIVETRPLPPDTTSPHRTWLLLRMYCVVPLCTRPPSVPPQQKPFAMSCVGLPEVPSWIGGVCFAVWLTPPPPAIAKILLPVTISTTWTPSISEGRRPGASLLSLYTWMTALPFSSSPVPTATTLGTWIRSFVCRFCTAMTERSAAMSTCVPLAVSIELGAVGGVLLQPHKRAPRTTAMPSRASAASERRCVERSFMGPPIGGGDNRSNVAGSGHPARANYPRGADGRQENDKHALGHVRQRVAAGEPAL